MTSLLEKLASVELMAEQFESIVRSAEADIHGSDHSASSFADARGSADTSSLNDANMPRPARERTTSWGGSMRVSGLFAGARNMLSAGRRKRGHDSDTAQCDDDGGGEDEQSLAMEAPIQQLCRRVAELRVWMHELAVEGDSSAVQRASAADLVTKMELVVGDFEQRLTQLLRNAGEAATAAARAARQGATHATAQVIAALDAIHEATGRLQREQREREAAAKGYSVIQSACSAAAGAAAFAMSQAIAAENLVAMEMERVALRELALQQAAAEAASAAAEAAAVATGIAHSAAKCACLASKNAETTVADLQARLEHEAAAGAGDWSPAAGTTRARGCGGSSCCDGGSPSCGCCPHRQRCRATASSRSRWYRG